MADETKNVFVSHVHEDDDGLAKLKDLLNSPLIKWLFPALTPR